MPFNNLTPPTPPQTPPSNNNPYNFTPPTAGAASASTVPEDLVDMNANAAKMQPVLFRDGIIAQLEATLIAKKKPNAILIGDAGVGKTAIVEELTRRIETAYPTLPPQLAKSRVYSLSIGNLVAGTGLAGSLEEKIKDIMSFVSDPKNHAILFIDEIHQLTSSHDSHSGKIAQIIKPELSRGSIHVIGATTTQEARTLRGDPAFNRRFTTIQVPELSDVETETIVESSIPSLLKHHKNMVAIDTAIIKDVISVADEFKAPGNHRPDTALTLLDRCAADTIVTNIEFAEQLKNNPMAQNVTPPKPPYMVTTKQIKKTAMRIMSGSAAKTTFNEDEFKSDMNYIIGQDKALDDVSKLLKMHHAHLFPTKTPTSMLFVGPSGVGKTEIAKGIACVLGVGEPIIINMCEFSGTESINRLIGAPAGFVGYDSAEELPFDTLMTNPYQVIVLDEFEKGARNVQRLFMSVLDEGFFVDARNRRIDFSRAIVIITTNAGQTNEASMSRGCDFMSVASNNDTKMLGSLSSYFDIEFLGRVNMKTTFAPLTKETYITILKNTYAHEVARIIKDQPYITLDAELSDEDADMIANETYVRAYGARPAFTAIKNFINDKVI